MRGLIFAGDRRLEFGEFEEPAPGPGEALIRVQRAAVCGTDIHKYRAAPEDIEQLPGGGALISGHEPAGHVALLGPGVKGIEPGAPVLLAGVLGCGRCRWCRQGYNTACERGVSGLGWKRHGCNAEYIAWPASNVLELPDNVSLDAATVLTCAGGTAYTALREAQLQPEDRLAVVGLGPVGLCAVILAHAMGVRTAGIDISHRRIDMAVALGLDLGVDAGTHDAVQAVRNWSGGRGADVVAECVGSARARHQALEMAAVRGRVAFAGLGSEELALSADRFFVGGQITVLGIAATPLRYFPDLIRIAAEKRLGFDRLITHRFPLSKAAEAYHVMESGDCGKVVFEIGA